MDASDRADLQPSTSYRVAWRARILSQKALPTKHRSRRLAPPRASKSRAHRMIHALRFALVIAASETSDPWGAWVFATCSAQVPELLAVRDRLLDLAEVDARTTVLDLGTGEGLVGTGALQRGASVIFSDISPRLLEECERRVGDSDRQRTHFLLASADDLAALADNSVDVVTSRSVLIYLDDIQAAVDEAFRVLRPEGRLSLFEPVNSFTVDSRIGDFCGYDLRAIADLADRVRATWTRSRS